MTSIPLFINIPTNFCSFQEDDYDDSVSSSGFQVDDGICAIFGSNHKTSSCNRWTESNNGTKCNESHTRTRLLPPKRPQRHESEQHLDLVDHSSEEDRSQNTCGHHHPSTPRQDAKPKLPRRSWTSTKLHSLRISFPQDAIALTPTERMVTTKSTCLPTTTHCPRTGRAAKESSSSSSLATRRRRSREGALAA